MRLIPSIVESYDSEEKFRKQYCLSKGKSVLFISHSLSVISKDFQILVPLLWTITQFLYRGRVDGLSSLGLYGLWGKSDMRELLAAMRISLNAFEHRLYIENALYKWIIVIFDSVT